MQSFTHHRHFCSLIMAGVTGICAANTSADLVRLSTGEVLNVTILETTADTMRIQHPLLGELTLPLVSVEVLPAESVSTETAPPPLPPPPAAEPAPAADAAPPPAETPKEWKFKFTLAGGASTGNTENANLVTKFDAVRETEQIKTMFDLGFFYAESDNVTSETKFTAGARNDWLNPDSKWFYFADARYDFDDFQSWNHRVSGHVGIGYKLIEPPKWRINLLAGIGAIREWGSDNDDIRPEALLGVEGEWQIAEKHSLKFDSTIYPDLKDTGEFRWVNNVGWACILDEKTNLSLTAGLAHEYQSTVDPGRKRNDLRVFAGLAMEF